MGQLITIDNVLAGKKDIIDWLYIGYKKDGGTFPLKVWENLECVLQKHNIKLRLNLINHEIDYLGLNGSQTRNGKMTDIYALQIKEGLGLSREETANSIMRIAEKYSYNPFVDMLKSNKNDDFAIIKDMFEVLEIEEDNEEILNYYSTIFVKWLLNVVKMAHNTLDNNFSGQGVLVLQGGQGCYKSTFCRNLLPNSKWSGLPISQIEYAHTRTLPSFSKVGRVVVSKSTANFLTVTSMIYLTILTYNLSCSIC